MILEDSKILLEIKKCINFGSLFMLTISYSIGAGLVSYLGKGLDLQIFILGLVIVLLFNISKEILSCFFKFNESFLSNRSKKSNFLKNSFLILSLSCLTIGAMLSVLLFSKSSAGLILWVFLGIFFIFLFLYAIPPFNFKKKGYGDLLIAISVIAVSPAFALILQLNEIHTTLFLITFPSFFLLLAYFLAHSLQNYYINLKNQNHTLMTKFGWKTGMSLHNLFLLTTFLLYGLASIIGLSEKLALPALVSFPIACIQFWEMWRISEGYKPRWKLLKISSLGSISILAYFLLFILWLR